MPIHTYQQAPAKRTTTTPTSVFQPRPWSLPAPAWQTHPQRDPATPRSHSATAGFSFGQISVLRPVPAEPDNAPQIRPRRSILSIPVASRPTPQLKLNRTGLRNGVQPGLVVQPKLTIGAPDDKYEREADRVASQVVQQLHSPASPATQLQAAPEAEKLQMKPLLQIKGSEGSLAAPPAIESSIQQLHGRGQPLAAPIRQPMERAFGADFRGVRVHTDATSDQLNQALQAQAFTSGQDLFFRQGLYAPGSHRGRELLAHELTHVVQQRTGCVKNPFGAQVATVHDQALEAEAERMGRQAAAHPLRGQTSIATTPGNDVNGRIACSPSEAQAPIHNQFGLSPVPAPVIQCAPLFSRAEFERKIGKVFLGKTAVVSRALDTYLTAKTQGNLGALVTALRTYIGAAQSTRHKQTAYDLMTQVKREALEKGFDTVLNTSNNEITADEKRNIVDKFQSGDKLYGLADKRPESEVRKAYQGITWVTQDEVSNQFLGTAFNPSNNQLDLNFATYGPSEITSPLPREVQEFKNHIERHPKYSPLSRLTVQDRAKRINLADKTGLEFWAGVKRHVIFFTLDGLNMGRVTDSNAPKSFTGRELRKLYRDRHKPYLNNVKFFLQGIEVDPPWTLQRVDFKTGRTWATLWQDYDQHRTTKIQQNPTNYSGGEKI